jgi:hypothetical protein
MTTHPFQQYTTLDANGAALDTVFLVIPGVRGCPSTLLV